MAEQNLFDIKTAASYLCVGDRKLRDLIKCGLIKHHQHKPGASILFRKEWLDAYIDKNAKGGL
ncbi:MAG: excisionase family DNA-binding protein [Spirochaetia bacterium]